MRVPFVNLARADDILPGQTKFVPRESGPILLANYEGAIYAVSGICPHQMNPLDGAVMCGPRVECPWHQFQFDCRTGENHHPANAYPPDLQHLRKQMISLKSYAVEMRDGDVWVDLP